MAQTQVTTGQMATVASQLDQVIQQYHTAYTQIQTLGTELDSTWTGDSSKKFQSIMAADLPKFQQFEQMLTAYSTDIKNAANTYATAESNAISAIQAQH
jgi:WXG100 family type VII secretion target